MPDATDPIHDDLAGVRLGVLSALHDGDAGLAYHLVLGLMSDGYGMGAILEEVLAPIQWESGRRWENGDYSISEEHASTTAAETLVALLGGAFDQPADAPHVVVVCAEGESHTLPARMATALLAYEGFRTTFLGSAVPATDLSAFLANTRPDALVVSCTRAANLAGARACVAAAHGAAVPVVVGGRAFAGGDERWRAVGADAHASSLSALPELLQTWSPDPVAAEEQAADPAPLLGLLARVRPAVVTDACAHVADHKSDQQAADAWLVAGVEELFDNVLAAAYLHDPALLGTQATWMAALLAQRHGSTATATDLLHGLGDALGQHAPEARALVDDALASLASAD